MKKILVLIAAIFLVFSMVSCNLDGEEGLIQAAGNSSRQISFKVYEILGKSSDGIYLSTDKGIQNYTNRTFEYLMGTGTTAKNAIAVESDSQYYYVKDNSIVDATGTSIIDMSAQPSYYDIDSNSYTIVYKDSDGYHLYHGTSIDPSDTGTLLTPNPGETIDSVTIIGDDSFMVAAHVGAEKKNYTTTSSCSLTATGTKHYVAECGDVWVEGNGKVYRGSTYIDTIELSGSRRPAMLDDGANVYIIASPSSKVYEVGASEMTTKTISGLNSLDVIAFLFKDGNNLNIMTSNSGTWAVDIANETKKEVKITTF